ncbi:MAG: substrate-binding domain-containing protein [Rhodospirillaceae bacterium]
MRFRSLFVAALFLTLFLSLGARAQERFIVVASTTSTEQSGLFGYLLPRFKIASGITVHVVAQGTGQALKTASNGDADVVLVHDRGAEEAFVAAGFGLQRREVMYNDFVIVGPATDPAGIRGSHDVAGALKRIAAAGAPFISRGDNSGTHAAERRLWKTTGIEPRPGLSWYRATGSGMGPTLNIAAGIDGYTLSDRGTWLRFGNRRSLELLVTGDPRLFNQYSAILVNPARFPHVKAADGQAFIDWLCGAEGQQAIDSFTVNGEQLFFANASAETLK